MNAQTFTDLFSDTVLQPVGAFALLVIALIVTVVWIYNTASSQEITVRPNYKKTIDEWDKV